jgi:subtilase family serine protease
VDVAEGAGAPGSGEPEVLLDIDTVMSLALDAKEVVVYDGLFTGRGSFQAMFNAMISGAVHILSNSWAYCEDQTDLADVQSIDSILATAAGSGITVLNGAGDHGSTCLDEKFHTIHVPTDAPHGRAVAERPPPPNVAGTYGSET